jgi:hypothetical protein
MIVCGWLGWLRTWMVGGMDGRGATGAAGRAVGVDGEVPLDLLRKSGEFFVMKEDLDDQTEAANEGI